VVIVLLSLAEVRNYLTPRFQEHMVVDTSLRQQLRIDINITFHALNCNDVSACLFCFENYCAQ
jgi:hypothetical protein